MFKWLCHNILYKEIVSSRLGTAGQLQACHRKTLHPPKPSLTADPRVASLIPTPSHTFVEIDIKITSTVILILPLIQEGLLSVTSHSMCTKYWLTALSCLPKPQIKKTPSLVFNQLALHCLVTLTKCVGAGEGGGGLGGGGYGTFAFFVHWSKNKQSFQKIALLHVSVRQAA